MCVKIVNLPILNECDIMNLMTNIGVDDLYQIGDKVFYPMHGAGIVQDIIEKEVLGKKREYYVIDIPISNMDIMIPVNNINNTGIRPVASIETAQSILYSIQNDESSCDLPWKARFKQNTDKLKTGVMQDAAEVVKDLLYRQKEKPLNSTEKQMLNDAQKILISEICVIKDIVKYRQPIY